MTTTIKTTNETKILLQARELIQKGWCQNQSRLVSADGQMSYCAGGAIDVAANNVAVALAAPFRFRARTLFIRTVGGGIEAWNDRLGRKKEEVLAAFDRAISHSMNVEEP